MLKLGTIVISIGLILLAYGFAKVSFLGSENTCFQTARFWLPLGTAALVYLIISGTILDVLRLVQPLGFNVLVPAATITLAFSFSIILFVTQFSQQHQRLYHAKFLSQ